MMRIAAPLVCAFVLTAAPAQSQTWTTPGFEPPPGTVPGSPGTGTHHNQIKKDALMKLDMAFQGAGYAERELMIQSLEGQLGAMKKLQSRDVEQ